MNFLFLHDFSKQVLFENQNFPLLCHFYLLHRIDFSCCYILHMFAHSESTGLVELRTVHNTLNAKWHRSARSIGKTRRVFGLENLALWRQPATIHIVRERTPRILFALVDRIVKSACEPRERGALPAFLITRQSRSAPADEFSPLSFHSLRACACNKKCNNACIREHSVKGRERAQVGKGEILKHW